MVRFHDRTIFIIIGNLKFEFWIQVYFRMEYLRIYLFPSFELILRDYVYGFILNANMLIFNSGVSIQYMTEEEKKEVLEELNSDQDSSD